MVDAFKCLPRIHPSIMQRKVQQVISLLSLILTASLAYAPVSSFASLTLSRERMSHTIVLHESLLDRFANPKIDDPWLVFNEAGVSQIVAPSLQLFWLLGSGSRYPTWARPILLDSSTLYASTRGGFLAPTLIHGAGLACCWLLGCLAAKAYEKEAFTGDPSRVVFSTIKAGAFACGILILATQVDLYKDMGGYVQLGESVETDARILTAAVEVVNDIVFEGIILTAYRLYRSKEDL
jgi:hypothetical protein